MKRVTEARRGQRHGSGYAEKRGDFRLGRLQISEIGKEINWVFKGFIELTEIRRICCCSSRPRRREGNGGDGGDMQKKREVGLNFNQ